MKGTARVSSSAKTIDRTLSNGLRVILRESHDAPVASFWVWYRVGARNETPGLTGISHWVEHMQFKGTQTLGKGEIFREISRNGGYNNAMTSNDWTAYYETLPSDRLNLAISIEADRMSNSIFDPEETESERTVILSEQQGAENSPSYQLYKEVVGTAFRNHPYGKMVIGYEHDLKTITRDDLFNHYRQSYVPNNAYVVVAGDFAAEEVAQKIENAFGAIPIGQAMPPVRAIEPEQIGERRVTIHKSAPNAFLRVGFRTPSGEHPDTAALLVADAVLSGAKGMGIAGGGPMGRSSRLYRALVATGLARSAGSDFDFFVDPYLLMIGIAALPGVEPESIETALDAELSRLATESVPVDEFARAVKQVKAQYVYSGEGVTNQAFWLGQMELIGDYTRADSFIAEIETVSPEDILRIAQTYFRKENRTTGWLLPEEVGSGSAQPLSDLPGAVARWGINGNGGKASKSLRPFERADLTGGKVLLGQAQPDDPSVSLRFRVSAGSMHDPADKSGLAALIARSLSRGTSSRTFEAINQLTDGLGASISLEPSHHSIDLRVRALSEDLATVIELASDILRNPVFPELEVEKVRAEILAGIKEQENDTRATSDRSMRELLYPIGHPLRHRVSGDRGSIDSITRQDLVAHHDRYFGPGNLKVSAVGGFDAVSDVAELIENNFSGWRAIGIQPHLDLTVARPTSSQRAERSIPGKSQADVVIGFPVLSRLDPGFQPFDMANLILGRLGLMGRLGANVRDRQGLAYYAVSMVEPGRAGSVWLARAGVDPKNIDRAIAGTIDEIRRLISEPVPADELDDAKSYLTGVLPLALETNDGIASLLLSIEHFELGLDYIERYPGIIRAIDSDSLLQAATQNLDPDRLLIGVASPV